MTAAVWWNARDDEGYYQREARLRADRRAAAEERIGTRAGHWIVVAVAHAPGPLRHVLECRSCGASTVASLEVALTTPCYALGPDGEPCLEGVSDEDDPAVVARLCAAHHVGLDEGARVDDDPAALAWISVMGASTLEEVGALLGGVSRERARQIEAGALEAVRERLAALGW